MSESLFKRLVCGLLPGATAAEEYNICRRLALLDPLSIIGMLLRAGKPRACEVNHCRTQYSQHLEC